MIEILSEDSSSHFYFSEVDIWAAQWALSKYCAKRKNFQLQSMPKYNNMSRYRQKVCGQEFWYILFKLSIEPMSPTSLHDSACCLNYIDLAKKVVYYSSCLATLNRMFACRVVILGNRNAKVDSLVEYQGPQGAETIYSPLANLRGSEPVGALACAILSSLFIMSFLSNFVSGNLAMTEFNSEYEHPISAVLEHFESGPWPGLDHMSGRAAAGLGHGQ